MEVVGEVEAGFVEVEGVAVLHEELADAQEPGLGAGLVAELGLDLVPDLGELLVGAELGAGDGGHDLFMGHAEAELCALAVCQAKHVLAHGGPASGLFPDFFGVDGREEELLADAVHLLADDCDDLVDGTVAEEEVAVDAGAELAHIACAQQELVACDLCVGGGFAQGGDEELGPAMHELRRTFRLFLTVHGRAFDHSNVGAICKLTNLWLTASVTLIPSRAYCLLRDRRYALFPIRLSKAKVRTAGQAVHA